MTKQLEALIASIKDTIDDAILNYGESWDSALVQVGANTAVHAICSDAIGGEIVVYAADGSHGSSWLCDYLESVSPENVKALIAALEQAQQYAKQRDEENQDLMLTIGRLRVEREQLEASPLAVKLPPLNDELSEILGRPNFTCAHIAEVLRRVGQEIARKSECEQAAVIYWMLNLYLEHGSSWGGVAKAELQAIVASASQVEGE